MTPFTRHQKQLDALQRRVRQLGAGGNHALAAKQLLDDLHAQALRWRVDYEHFRTLSLPEFKRLVDIKEQLFDELSAHARSTGSADNPGNSANTDRA